MSLWYALLSVSARFVSKRRSLLQNTYAPGSPERAALQAAIAQMEQELPFEVPIVINGARVRFRPHMSVTNSY